MERSIGATCNPDGILADAALRTVFLPRDALTYDAMHILLSNGIMAEEIHLLLEAARAQLGMRYRDLRARLQAWSWPGEQGRSGGEVADIFSDAREAVSRESFKASAGEVVTVFPWLHFLAATELSGHHGIMRNVVASFTALCKVAATVMSVKKGAPWQGVVAKLPA